jgi:hypothetical protein
MDTTPKMMIPKNNPIDLQASQLRIIALLNLASDGVSNKRPRQISLAGVNPLLRDPSS